MSRREPSRKRGRRLPPARWEELDVGDALALLDASLLSDGYIRARDVKCGVTASGLATFRFRWFGNREVISLTIRGVRS